MPDAQTPSQTSTGDPRLSALHAGLQALGLAAPDGGAQRLLQYLDLIAKWNRAYNLTAVREPQAMLHQHLLDCLAALPALDRHAADKSPMKMLDVGSGAGLPGVVLALMRPQWQVTCIDSVAKKASFIRQAGGELGLPNLQAVHGRVEALAGGAFTLITSRAFASLADFTRLTRAQLAPGGCWVAMKGQHPAEEVAALPPSVQVFHVEQLQVPGLDAQRCLVWMKPS